MGDKFTVYVNFKLRVPSVVLAFQCCASEYIQVAGSVKMFSNKGFVSVCHFKWGIITTKIKMSPYTG